MLRFLANLAIATQIGAARTITLVDGAAMSTSLANGVFFALLRSPMRSIADGSASG